MGLRPHLLQGLSLAKDKGTPMGLDLITLAEYKAHVGILGDSQDAQIKSLIPKASALIKSLCRRTFLDYVDDVKVDVFKGGRKKLFLLESPLLAVQSVEFSNDYGKTYTALDEYTDYVIDVEDSSVEFILDYYADYYQVNAFKVTYTAGYEELPVDLKLAVIDTITYLLRNESAVHSNKAVGTNTMQIEYITNSQMPVHIRRVLALYSDNYA